MALAGDIQKMVKGAMALLDGFELGERLTYYHVQAPTYDPATGTVTPNAVTYTRVPATLVRFSLDEKDDEVVVVTDRKALIAYLDLPIKPTESDWFTDKVGQKWEVKRFLGVPGDSLLQLHVRRA